VVVVPVLLLVLLEVDPVPLGVALLLAEVLPLAEGLLAVDPPEEVLLVVVAVVAVVSICEPLKKERSRVSRMLGSDPLVCWTSTGSKSSSKMGLSNFASIMSTSVCNKFSLTSPSDPNNKSTMTKA